MGSMGSSSSHKGHSEGRSSSETSRNCIKVVFDTRSSVEARRLENFKSAFGEDYVSEEYLLDGRVILTLLPGGAKDLL